MIWYVHRRNRRTGAALTSFEFPTMVEASWQIPTFARCIDAKADYEVWLWEGAEFAITRKPMLSAPEELGLLGGDIA